MSLNKVLIIAAIFLLPSFADAAVFYTDFSCATPGNGTTPTCSGAGAPFNSLDAFTEVARTAGDILFVRRDTSTTTSISDLNFTSSGSDTLAIAISADYDNIWGDFATSTQTYTVTQASTTLLSSASTTGIVAGDWIYVEGDCYETANTATTSPCMHAYEVKSLTSTKIELYMPYKGMQSGSGKYLRVMGKNPIWNSTTGDFQWNFDVDSYWAIKGMHIRGTDTNGNVEIDSAKYHSFIDVIFEGNNSTAYGMRPTDDNFVVSLNKCRFTNHTNAVLGTADTYGNLYMFDSILTPGTANSNGMTFNSLNGSVDFVMRNNTYTGTGYFMSAFDAGSSVELRDNIATSTIYWNRPDTSTSVNLKMENSNGNNINVYSAPHMSTNITGRFFEYAITSTTTPTLARSGGGATTLIVRVPQLSRGLDFSRMPYFEYPIYAASTTMKTYTMYVKTLGTWSYNIGPEYLFLECSYLGQATGQMPVRMFKRSTSTVDFVGSSDWQPLSVSCQPTQDGTLYLSLHVIRDYKSFSVSNQFYLDSTPVITTTP